MDIFKNSLLRRRVPLESESYYSRAPTRHADIPSWLNYHSMLGCFLAFSHRQQDCGRWWEEKLNNHAVFCATQNYNFPRRFIKREILHLVDEIRLPSNIIQSSPSCAIYSRRRTANQYPEYLLKRSTFTSMKQANIPRPLLWTQTNQHSHVEQQFQPHQPSGRRRRGK